MTTERECLVDWILQQIAEGWDGCLTGDCPHDCVDDCIAAILGRFDADQFFPATDEPLPDTDTLPELTAEDREALDAVDLSDSLGTWRERAGVAERAALRWFRQLRVVRAEAARTAARLDAARTAARLRARHLTTALRRNKILTDEVRRLTGERNAERRAGEESR